MVKSGERPVFERLENLASHLRTVHFSLLVVSLACLVAMSVQVPADVRLAIDDLNRLGRLEDRDPATWLREIVPEEVYEEGLPPEERVLHVYSDGEVMLRTVGTVHDISMLCEFPELVVSSREGDFFDDVFYFYGATRSGAQGTTPVGVGRGALEAVRRPRQVRDLWDALGRASSVVYVPTGYTVLEPDMSRGTFRQRASGDGAGAGAGPDPVKFPLDFVPCEGKPWVRKIRGREVILGGCWTNRSNSTFELELVLEKHSVLLTAGFADYLSVATVEPDFSRAFPALNRWLVGSSADDFDVLRAELSGAQALAEREQVLELFGAEVPISHLALWGSIAVLALQLYLLLHARQLEVASAGEASSLLRTDPPFFPWVALYRGRPAAWVAYGSVALLPAAVVCILSWQSHSTGGSLWSGVVGALASIGLAWTCWAILRRIRRTFATVDP